jgi:hypothetical protein
VVDSLFSNMETYIPHGNDMATLNRIGFRYQGLQPDQFTIQVLPIIVRDLISKDVNQLANGKVTVEERVTTLPVMVMSS